MLSLYTALCADQLVFNSAYNRETFLQGVTELLGKLPDHVPAGLVERLQHARVIPVPLSEDVFAPAARSIDASEPDVLNIVWNHRWEYDKGPALLLAIVEELIASGLRFRLHLLGQRFRQAPAPLQQLQALLECHCAGLGIEPGHSGYIADRRAYCQLLASADVALSTALHDFQGLSLLEATALGCTPLAPRRLVYPEYLGPEFLYATTEDNGEETPIEAHAAVQRLQDWARRKALGQTLPKADVQRFRQSSLQTDYAALLHALTVGQGTARQNTGNPLAEG
jgi:glycosyltransferase involved in cell wall biosynthesis